METLNDIEHCIYKDSYNPLCLITGSESGAIHRILWDRYRPIGARLYDASVVDTLRAGRCRQMYIHGAKVTQ